MLRRVHPIAGLIGFLTILTFWISTVTVELFGSEDAVSAVKHAIPWGLLVLVPALVITGATGFVRSRGVAEPRILAKKRRMPFIAGNGLLILVPSVLYLDRLASRADFGATFSAVQAVELIAGAVNLTLMSLNARDGLRLTGRLPDAYQPAPGSRP